METKKKLSRSGREITREDKGGDGAGIQWGNSSKRGGGIINETIKESRNKKTAVTMIEKRPS